MTKPPGMPELPGLRGLRGGTERAGGTGPDAEPCRILRVTLAGFGVYSRPTEFRFPAGAAVLRGPNESGKTTLLHGLTAILFGLPTNTNTSLFGSARFRSLSPSKEFWGEIEWQRGESRFTLHRAFESHRVHLIEEAETGTRVLFRGEHNPRATSSAGSSFPQTLRSLLGLSSPELFRETFCVSQPLPAGRSLSTELQHLLSGSRSGRMDRTLTVLFQEVCALTRATGDMGLVRPGGKRPANQREPGRRETLEEEISLARSRLQEGQDLLGRLNFSNEALETAQNQRRALEESKRRREGRLKSLERFLSLDRERVKRGTTLQQIRRSGQQIVEIEARERELAPDLEGRFACYRERPEDLPARLDAIEEADRSWDEAGRLLARCAEEREALTTEIGRLEGILQTEFSDVRGRLDLCPVHEQLTVAVARREKRRAAIAAASETLAAVETRVAEHSAWEGLAPTALRSQAELILAEVTRLHEIEKRLWDIDGLLASREFLAGERLDLLHSKIAAGQTVRELRALTRELDAGLASGAEDAATRREERSAREAESAELARRLEFEFASVRGRPELPALRGDLIEALERCRVHEETQAASRQTLRELEQRLAEAGPPAEADPEALRLEVEALRADLERTSAQEARLRQVEERLRDRDLLPPAKMTALKEKVGIEQEARELKLRLRELETAAALREKAEAQRETAALRDQAGSRDRSEAASRAVAGGKHLGPVRLALAAGALAVSAAVLRFALGLDWPAALGIGLGASLLVLLVGALSGRKRSEGAVPAALAEKPAVDSITSTGSAGSMSSMGSIGSMGSMGSIGESEEDVPGAAAASAEELEALRRKREEQFRRAESLGRELGPYANTTAAELSAMEARWAGAEDEAQRLREEASDLCRRRFGTRDAAAWRDVRVEQLPEQTRGLLRIPGAPGRGTAGDLADWALALPESTWSEISGRRSERAALELERAHAERELRRLEEDRSARREVERLRRKLAPFTEETSEEDLRERVETCLELERRLHALDLRLSEMPPASNLEAAQGQADERLSETWSAMARLWPLAPAQPSLEAASGELRRLECEIETIGAKLGPYQHTTGPELEAMERSWQERDEETARLRAEHSSICLRRFAALSAGEILPDAPLANWESLPAAGQPEPFPSLLRLREIAGTGGARSTGVAGSSIPETLGTLVDWLGGLSDAAWVSFSRRSDAFETENLSLASLRQELERLTLEDAEDQEPEHLAERLAPFTLETSAEFLEERIERCAELERRLHAGRHQLEAMPYASVLQDSLDARSEAVRALSRELKRAWPAAPVPPEESIVPGSYASWVRRIREEERLAREAWNEAAQLNDSRGRVLAAVGAGSLDVLQARETEEGAALGALLLQLDEIEARDPLIAGTREEGEEGARFQRLHDRAEEERTALEREEAEREAAETRERELLREIAGREGTSPDNLARLEIRITSMEEELRQVRFQAEALGLAFRWAEEAAREFQSAYREDLEGSITERFAALTGVPGRRVVLDSSFALSVCAPSGDPLAMEQLSQGTMDQLLLAIRLAVADLLTDSVPLPLFFDDPFVHFDAGRIALLRSALERIGRERQWVLLTHREEFESWAGPITRADAGEGVTPS